MEVKGRAQMWKCKNVLLDYMVRMAAKNGYLEIKGDLCKIVLCAHSLSKPQGLLERTGVESVC